MAENNFQETNLENGGEAQGDGTNGDLVENMEEVEQKRAVRCSEFEI